MSEVNSHTCTRVASATCRTWVNDFNPIQARGALCAPLTYITAYLPNGLEFGVTALGLFFICIYHSEKFSSTNQPTCMLPWQPCNFGLFLKTQISIVFQVFPPERNFLWDNFLCFGHLNSLISSIKANIRSVTMETFQKFLLPKYGQRH